MVEDDATAARAAAQGDRAALDGLLRRYRTAVLSITYGWTKNLADAEDLTQECLAQVVSRIGQLRDPEAFGGWIRTIALNQCRVWYRWKSTMPEAERLDLVDEPGSGEPLADQRHEGRAARRTVVDLFDLLADDVAMAAQLHYVDGLTAPQIAAALAVPVPTIEGRLHRARTRFRRALGQPAADNRMKELLLKLITLCEGVVKMDRIRMEIGSDFVPLVNKEPPNLISEIGSLRTALEADASMLLPAVRVIDSVDLGPLEYRILIHESETARGAAQSDAEALATALAALEATVLEHRKELAP